MSKATVRGGFDTYSGSAYPAREHGSAKYLRTASGLFYSYIYLRNPAPRGATIESATLTLYARGSSSGARTLTAARVASSWKARRLNWNNQPGVLTGGVTAAVNVVSDEDAITFDVTSHLQSITDGSRHFGWRIANSTATLLKLYSFNAGENKPTLEVVWSDAPDAPTSLSPADSVIATDLPILRFDYTDVSGSTELAAVNVQIDAAQDGVTPDFDSGTVASTEPELDLSTTAYGGLANLASTYWRVRVQDAGGLWSDWSDWAQMTRTDRGTLTVTVPASGAPTVADNTPTISWTYSGTQAFWRVTITKASNTSRVIYDSGKRAGTATSHTIPAGYLKDDSNYRVIVRSWDNVADREATPGVPTYVSVGRDFTITDDVGVTKPSSVTVSTTPGAPWVDVTWQSAVIPDTWSIYRDGRLVESELDPADVLVGGAYTYTYRDYTPRPFRSAVYSVRGVVNKSRSQPTTATAITPDPSGIWIIDTDRALEVPLAGDDAGSWAMPDEAETYTPIGSSESIRIVSGMRGFEGSLSGVIAEGYRSLTAAAVEADLIAIKERPAGSVRLVAGDVNIEAILGNISVSPTSVSRSGEVLKDVSFDFWQIGDIGFDPDL